MPKHDGSASKRRGVVAGMAEMVRGLPAFVETFRMPRPVVPGPPEAVEAALETLSMFLPAGLAMRPASVSAEGVRRLLESKLRKGVLGVDDVRAALSSGAVPPELAKTFLMAAEKFGRSRGGVAEIAKAVFRDVPVTDVRGFASPMGEVVGQAVEVRKRVGRGGVGRGPTTVQRLVRER